MAAKRVELPRTTTGLLWQTARDLRIDSAYLRMRSRDELGKVEAIVLREASDRISTVAQSLEEMERALIGPTSGKES